MTLLEERARTQLHDGVVDASPPPSSTAVPSRVTVATVLQALALLIVWLLLYLTVLSSFQHGHAQRSLYAELRTELALGEAPSGAPIVPGTPLAVLSIPALDLGDEVVVEGSRNEQLRVGPGHVTGTVLPGQIGVSVLAGRSTTFGGPFGGLDELRAGDPIVVTTVQGTFRYDVVAVRVKGDPVPAPPKEGQGRLTLVSSLPGPGPLGALRPANTVYVDAALESGAVAAGPVGQTDLEATYMSGRLDVPTLAQLALALQLLLLAVAGFAWGWHRGNRRVVWAAGIPVVVAALWLATSLSAHLIPGLI
ncbi:class E sortase [Mumia zhuanghuii]|uniref:Class E sortase n=2 Tax=Mumia TaxID=1546255 RepID=A0ABW1QPP1_9ACTN|nr:MULTISPECIES: class E sortase [Mumia]KAA1423914.1 class E sortase [Mumia zhuanghuii]